MSDVTVIDVERLLFVGEYIYEHTDFGEVKQIVSPYKEGFWVVDVFPHLAVGSVHAFRPQGLMSSDAKVLEAPTEAPPTSLVLNENDMVLVVPRTFTPNEAIVVSDETHGQERAKIELRVRARGVGEFILTMKAEDSEQVRHIEQTWKEGVGMVRQVFISPSMGEMKLVRHVPTG